MIIPIPLENRLSNAYITKVVVSLRTVSGEYLGGQGNVDLSQYIQNGSVYATAQGLTVVLTKSGGWGILNNTPIAGNVLISATFD